jgi:hypothetical protein
LNVAHHPWISEETSRPLAAACVGWTGRETVGGRGLVKGAAVSVAPPAGQLEKTFERIRPKADSSTQVESIGQIVLPTTHYAGNGCA